MHTNKILLSLSVLLALAGCKIEITVPKGGHVESKSGIYVCTAEKPCSIDVVDTTFDETFIAIPDAGFTFSGWRRKEEGFCAGRPESCRLYTTSFPGTPLMQFLESDEPFYLEPYFGKTNSWAQKPDMITGGGAISSCAVNGNLYVFGIGFSPTGTAKGAAKYDSVTDAWVSLPDMPEPQGWASAVAVNRKCYVIGGASKWSGEAIVSVNEFDTKTEEWSAIAPLPEGRAMAGAAALDGKIYVVGGGANISYFPLVRSSIAIYDIARNKWSKGADMPTSRFLLSADTIGRYIYAAGGSEMQGRIYSGVVERYDPSANSWSAVESMPTGRWGLTVTALKGKLYAIAGITNAGTSGLVERYDPETGKWISRAALGTSRLAHRSEVIDGRIFVAGGVKDAADYSSPPLIETEAYTH